MSKMINHSNKDINNLKWRAVDSDLLDAAVVDEASVRAGAGDDEFGSEESRRQLHLIVVYQTRFRLRERERERERQRERERERDG